MLDENPDNSHPLLYSSPAGILKECFIERADAFQMDQTFHKLQTFLESPYTATREVQMEIGNKDESTQITLLECLPHTKWFSFMPLTLG